jgi:hypothetical protein
MRIGDRELRPAIGYAIVREVEFGKSAGGISLEGGKTGKRLEILEVHPYSIDCGIKIEHDLKPGDYVSLQSGAQANTTPHYPAKTGLIRIEHVVAYERMPEH